VNGLKYGIANSQLTAGLIAGFIATFIATITGFWYKIIHLPPVDWNRFNGTYLVGNGGTSDFEIFLTGIALSLAFVFLVRPKIALPYTQLGNLEAAVIWGVVLGLISMFIITPYLDPYGASPGFMSLDLQLADAEGDLRPGWQSPLVILIWHLVYGIQLGAFYNPSPEAAPVAETAPAPTPAPAVPQPATS
jgi:hypothetical protein